jgi:hypothetical protein
MPRRRSTISMIRGLLYAPTRLLGDVSAARRGPEAMAKRLMRRATGNVTERMRGYGVGLVVCVLLTGCGLTFPRLSTDAPKPTVTFAMPAA